MLSHFTTYRIESYCRQRLAGSLNETEIDALRRHLELLLITKVFPSYRGRYLHLDDLNAATGIAVDRLRLHRRLIQPIFDAVARAVAHDAATPPEVRRKPKASRRQTRHGGHPGPKARPVIDFPTPLYDEWIEPAAFEDALNLQVARHGDSLSHLFKAIVQPSDNFHHTTLFKWGREEAFPRSVKSFEILSRIERRYQLPPGYFREKLPNQIRAVSGLVLEGISPNEQRRLAWHLPHDFARCPRAEQQEILEWVRRVIITGSTEYRRYQAEAMKQRYAVRFRSLQGGKSKHPIDADCHNGVVDAPSWLEQEMLELMKFKTWKLTAFGLQRNGVGVRKRQVRRLSTSD